jgi:hypothetical protein
MVKDDNEKEQLRLEEIPKDYVSDDRKKYISGVDIIASVTALIRKYVGNDDITKLLDDYRTVLIRTFLNNGDSFLGAWKKMKGYHEAHELVEDEDWIAHVNKMAELRNYYKSTV